jgi:transcriptional regulator with XRE-family HTH domain
MTYGLDFTDVRYETDHLGNRLRATIPYTMFSALTEFWKEARRAQTAAIENAARPGQYKGSLQSAVAPNSDTPQSSEVVLASARSPILRGKPARHAATWQQLLAQLPVEAAQRDAMAHASAQAVADSDATGAATAKSRSRSASSKTPQVVFIREFVSAPPEEVMQQIRQGIYFLKAWRLYRNLTMLDVAELIGKHRDTVNWHENGYSRPTAQTLARYVDIFDCTVEQLTAKPKSNTQPWLTVIHNDEVRAARQTTEPHAPEDTDYPDAVLAHLLAGKTPLTAWRLYRGLTLAQLATQYGATSSNLKTMEEAAYLRLKSREKMAPILKCKPVQLLRPEGLETFEREREETPTSRRITQRLNAAQR